MQSSVAREQLKFFHQNGYIEFEQLLSEADIKLLLDSIQKHIQECPGYAPDELTRFLPFLPFFVRRKHLADIAYQLIGKKPLRLAREEFFSSQPPTVKHLESDSYGLVLYLKGEQKKGCGLFFRAKLPETLLYKEEGACYLFLVFTTRPLRDDFNPIVYP